MNSLSLAWYRKNNKPCLKQFGLFADEAHVVRSHQGAQTRKHRLIPLISDTILPFYLPFIAADMRFLRMVRLFRLFRLLRGFFANHEVFMYQLKAVFRRKKK